MNWSGIAFSFGIPAGVVIWMTIILVKEHIENKLMDKRSHQRTDWWTLEVE